MAVGISFCLFTLVHYVSSAKVHSGLFVGNSVRVRACVCVCVKGRCYNIMPTAQNLTNTEIY